MPSPSRGADLRGRCAHVASAGVVLLLSFSLTNCGGDSTGPSGTTPDPNVDRLEIAFGYATGTSQRFETMDIFQSTKDGRLTAPLVATPDVEVDPQWSRDGSRLVFTRTDASGASPLSLGVVNADGSARRLLVIDPVPPSSTTFNNQSNGAWSPDGASIAFDRFIGETEAGIGIVGSDGTGVRWLTKAGLDPSWSSTDLIAYSGGSGIWTIRPDGSGATQVTTVAGDVFPRWSRDGTRLVFLNRTMNSSGTTYDVVTTRADGTERRTLVTGGNNVNASWSPDGAYILYEHLELGDLTAPRCTLHRIPSNGGQSVNLTPDRGVGFCGGASWRPF